MTDKEQSKEHHFKDNGMGACVCNSCVEDCGPKEQKTEEAFRENFGICGFNSDCDDQICLEAGNILQFIKEREAIVREEAVKKAINGMVIEECDCKCKDEGCEEEAIYTNGQDSVLYALLEFSKKKQ